ncbi:MAG TPA: hypothetical protein PKY50_17420 [Candidatus Competibacter sp.]|nr:hypothetical protein [Candidatus Competibacter sp.]
MGAPVLFWGLIASVSKLAAVLGSGRFDGIRKAEKYGYRQKYRHYTRYSTVLLAPE